MLTALERHGVRKLEPMGQKFDPNFHQADVTPEVPTHPNVPPTTPSSDVVQPALRDRRPNNRMLRPAMVGVAPHILNHQKIKGGPKDTPRRPRPGPSPQAEKRRLTPTPQDRRAGDLTA